jgi:DNA-binding response OmpR family regulator
MAITFSAPSDRSARVSPPGPGPTSTTATPASGPAARAIFRVSEGEGFTVEVAGNGTEGLELFRAAAPSVLVLDLSLPGTPGQDICREISQAAPSLPIIILSARTEVMDKVLLLELGAHDYVTKPFSPRELLARVRTAMRRRTAQPAVAETFSFGDVKVDFTKMELRRGGELVPMTSQEFKVLKFMIQNVERVLTREELLNQVWGYRNYPSTRTVDNHILRLRQKLEKDPANPEHFRTVHSAGRIHRFTLRATAQVRVDAFVKRARAPDVVSTRSSCLPGNETCSSIHSSSHGASCGR